ncbi:hypothetical protein ILUMI_01139 [Ignelater luminosus]|uniref:Kazal-like domain-containing protein n=1 Tax=Ignelater luminosus TaxID=2038154 RepID=A0A8K0GPI4_IGNLU|nr:hypothetical protein ILUMI_01139 [Ignelater luminosus]
MLSTLVFLVFLVTVSIQGASICPVCDQNDYNPVCAGGKAYASLCKLKREICLGRVVLVDWKYGTCTILREPPVAKRGDDHDHRVVFRFLTGRP